VFYTAFALAGKKKEKEKDENTFLVPPKYT
jgi:hypothetical protein